MDVIATVLNRFAPHLLEQRRIVDYKRELMEFEKETLERLKDTRRAVSGVLDKVEDPDTSRSLWNWIESIGWGKVRFKKLSQTVSINMLISKKSGQKFLTGGLSILQFLAICEILGVSIQSPDVDSILLLVIAAIAALSLTFATKEALMKLAKVEFREGRVNKPFWRYFREGDTLSWITFCLVGLEMTFAAPGLLSLLPPRLAAQFLPQFGAYVSSGLAAFINVLLAWALAIEEADTEKKYLQVVEVTPEKDKNESACQTMNLPPWLVHSLRKSHTSEVIEQKEAYAIAKKEFKQAYRPWNRKITRLFRRRDVRAYLLQLEGERVGIESFSPVQNENGARVR